jgi:hypothetical protein
MTDPYCPKLPGDPAGLGFVPAREGIWIDPRFQHALEEARLFSFDAVMATEAGHCQRKLQDRENWRIELGGLDGRGRAAYLKKHRAWTLRSWLRVKLGLAPEISAGELEASNVAQLVRAGIEVMRLIAYGRKVHGSGRVDSFVIAEGLEGYQELQELLRRRFAAGATGAIQSPHGRDPDLLRLIRTVADTARRFHAAGYNHRDFFCGHLFVREPERGRFEIRLIDLQRVQHRRRWRRRWIVKDLAQLAWSLPDAQITCSERMAFMRRYLGVDRLRVRHKRLIREVLAKQQLMERKLGPPAYNNET